MTTQTDQKYQDARMKQALNNLKLNLDEPADLDAGNLQRMSVNPADVCHVFTSKHNLDAALRQRDEDLTGTISTFCVCSSSSIKATCW